jgi:nucleotide-binding universal stress UspA family protein
MSLVYIAGYDGSPASLSAVGLTVALARAEGATVIAAHAHAEVPAMYADAGLDSGVGLYEELRARGERLLGELHLDGVGERVLLSGSPARALHELAEERGASLVAVGLTHREGLERLVAGSVPASLLHGSPCPVLTVPAGARTEPPKAIAVAYDGGAEARRALRAATRLAIALDAGLELLACFESPGIAANPLGGGLDFEPDMQAAFAQVAEEAAAGVAGVAVRTRILAGPAAHELAEATREGVDLLIAGSRGYGPLRSVIAGSVARHLVDHAACPVLVIPRSAEAEVDREPPPAAL